MDQIMIYIENTISIKIGIFKITQNPKKKLCDFLNKYHQEDSTKGVLCKMFYPRLRKFLGEIQDTLIVFHNQTSAVEIVVKVIFQYMEQALKDDINTHTKSKKAEQLEKETVR